LRPTRNTGVPARSPNAERPRTAAALSGARTVASAASGSASTSAVGIASDSGIEGGLRARAQAALDS
jgi:hypothetical protein